MAVRPFRKLKRKLIIFAIVVLLGFILLLLAPLLVIIMAASDSGASSSGALSVPLTVTGTYSGKDALLDFTGSGISIIGVPAEISGTTIRGSKGSGEVSMELPPPPASRTYFSYMPHFDQSLYTIKLDPDSAQMKYNKYCTTDSEGFRRNGDCYLVALGTYYGDTIGEKYRLTFKKKDGSAETILCARGDTKSDKDTDASHRYHLSDNTIVEFIMGGRGDEYGRAVSSKFTGELTGITKIDASVSFSGEISGGNITLSGIIEGVAFTAQGTAENGYISASGTLGTGDAAQGGGGASGQLMWPVPPGFTITSEFGPRISPGGIGSTNHQGIDAGCPIGTPVYAADGGTVKTAVSGVPGGRGNYIVIDHGSGLTTTYMHLDKVYVTPGLVVSKGQLIGLSGNTGNSTGPHLHFEVAEGLVPVNPRKYVTPV